MLDEQLCIGETLLRGDTMAATMTGMGKTEQIRLPAELVRDARICAQELHGESLPEYVTRALRDVVNREFPRAAAQIAKRAKGDAGK